MTYETILFDMDGVLLTGYHTSRDVYRQATAATLADFGVEYGTDLPPRLAEPDDAAEVRAACDDLGLPATAAWAYRERAATTMENEQVVAGDRTSFSDTDVLATLADDYVLGIVSNNRQGTVRFAADRFRWDVELVRGRYPILSEYDRLKPDPYLLEESLDRLDADDALFVGDRRTDVEAARHAGVDAALLARGGDPPDGNPDPEYHIESLEDLQSILSD